MSNEEKKPLEVVFAPGCFDDFDGTQKELDEMIAEINRLAETGELFERSLPVDLDELSDEELEELAGKMGIDLDDLNEVDLDEDVVNRATKRTLQ
jgi:hypothetical protein